MLIHSTCLYFNIKCKSGGLQCITHSWENQIVQEEAYHNLFDSTAVVLNTSMSLRLLCQLQKSTTFWNVTITLRKITIW
jgi:hypothetical protein